MLQRINNGVGFEEHLREIQCVANALSVRDVTKLEQLVKVFARPLPQRVRKFELAAQRCSFCFARRRMFIKSSVKISNSPVGSPT